MIVASSLDEEIYFTIKQAIVSRDLAPGTKLSEEVLANLLKVSRTPIRSALRRLSYERLVTIVPFKGAFVSKPTVKEVQDVFEMRILLEEHAIEKAFSNLQQPQNVELLEELLLQERRAYGDKNFDTILQRVRDFHIQIAQLSGNEILLNSLEELISLTNIYITFFSQINMASPDSPEEHREILQAIKHGDIDSAKGKMRAHINASLKRLNFDLIRNSSASMEEILYRSFQSHMGTSEETVLE
ncbi:MAG TPA: GntR family transcriptional regulator [Verrucomicrobiae bacterium]|nr:GntR family transcriptional regulator [Verrucomicrobiae bacterium]